MTFATIADIHHAPRRTESKQCEYALSLTGNFSNALHRHKASSAVVLGDLCQAESRFTDHRNIGAVRSVMPEQDLPVHYIPGNHEKKNLTEAQALQALGLKSPYYSVDRDGMHFVFLTPQTTHTPDIQIVIDPDQINWLKADLKKSRLPTVVFIHEPISNHNCFGNPRYSGWPSWALVENRNEIRKLLAKHGKVVAVMQGHLHRNSLEIHSGIPYLTLQSLVETVPGNKPAGTYCLTDLDPNGILNFRIYGHDLRLRADLKNSAHQSTKIKASDISAVYNPNALLKLHAILHSFPPELSFLEGDQLDYEQDFGKVIKISANIPTPNTRATRPNQRNQFDYYKHGLLTTLDTNEVSTIFANARQTLKPRGILQIDFLSGDPYLHIRSTTRLSNRQSRFNDNSPHQATSETIIPMHHEQTIIDHAKRHGFRHLKTLALASQASVLGMSGEVKCGMFMSIY